MPTVKLTDKAVQAAKVADGKRLELWDQATPGLCLRVSDSGSKVWVYRYRTDSGRQPRMTLGSHSAAFGLADARAAAARARVEVQNGKDPADEKKRRRVLAKAQPLKSFDDLADAYLEACEKGHWKPRKKQKRASTISGERAILQRNVRPAIGTLMLETIDRATIHKLLNGMLDRKIGAQTNKTHAIIRQVLAYGVAQDRLTVNVAASIQKPAAEAPRERILSDDELKGLWTALKAPQGLRKPTHKGSDETNKLYVGRPIAIAVQLCMILLQRRNEVIGMTLDELDLARGLWPAA